MPSALLPRAAMSLSLSAARISLRVAVRTVSLVLMDSLSASVRRSRSIGSKKGASGVENVQRYTKPVPMANAEVPLTY